jgi:hypothetical protein
MDTFSELRARLAAILPLAESYAEIVGDNMDDERRAQFEADCAAITAAKTMLGPAGDST